jgi:hypothetical protein
MAGRLKLKLSIKIYEEPKNGPRVPEAIATGGFSKKGYALV